MHSFGIREPPHQWIASYLKHRKHFTNFNNCSSSYRSMNCWIPQGSVPILFLIYINDVERSSKKLLFLLFADDTTIYLQGHDLQQAQDTPNSELVNVSNRISSNKLSLSLTNINYMISRTLLSLNVITSNSLSNRVNKVKFLGISIDNNLKWKVHSDEVKYKVSILTGMIHRIRGW